MAGHAMYHIFPPKLETAYALASTYAETIVLVLISCRSDVKSPWPRYHHVESPSRMSQTERQRASCSTHTNFHVMPQIRNLRPFTLQKMVLYLHVAGITNKVQQNIDTQILQGHASKQPSTLPAGPAGAPPFGSPRKHALWALEEPYNCGK